MTQPALPYYCSSLKAGHPRKRLCNKPVTSSLCWSTVWLTHCLKSFPTTWSPSWKSYLLGRCVQLLCQVPGRAYASTCAITIEYRMNSALDTTAVAVVHACMHLMFLWNCRSFSCSSARCATASAQLSLVVHATRTPTAGTPQPLKVHLRSRQRPFSRGFCTPQPPARRCAEGGRTQSCTALRSRLSRAVLRCRQSMPLPCCRCALLPGCLPAHQSF